jgi:histidinol-phosphatase (PHP family)
VIDLHLHTSRCGHATGTVDDYVDAGREAGLATICFTDHMPLPASWPQQYSMTPAEVGDYLRDVRDAAAYSRESGGPEVLCGIEADWLPECRAYTRDTLAALDLDMVLGSVHFLNGWAFDDPDLIDRYASLDVDALWERYFAEFADAAGSGLFNVMAHPDLVKKFGSRPSRDPSGLYEKAADAMAEGGCAVEVNTAGLRKPAAEIYPCLPLLAACRRRGIPATIGSDAHDPAEVGADGASALDLLLDAGYRSVVVFRHRRAEEVAL